MKSIKVHLASKQKKQKENNSFSSVSVDEKTIKHLFSQAIRNEYGRQGEKNIVPTFYKDGVVFVTIHNSIWAQELWVRREFLIRTINKKIGNDAVVGIKIATQGVR